LLRKAAIGLALILVVLVAGFLAAPYLIGLDSLKAAVIAQIEQRTGRPFDIAGPVRLALLPTPSIGAHDLRLGNPPGTKVPDMIRVRAVEMKLAFWPLLRGRIEVRRAELIEPELDVERLPDGSANWQPASRATVSFGQQPVAAASPSVIPMADLAFFVSTLDIEDGGVTYRSGTRVERFEHVNGTVVVDGPDGPFHLAGDLTSHGAALNLSADGGPIDGGTMPLHLQIAARPRAEAEFDGTVGGQLDAPTITGKLKLSVGDLADALATIGRAQEPTALAQPFALQADVSATGRHVVLEHASLDLGTAHGTGTVGLDGGMPFAVDLALHLTRLDLDRWLDVGHQAAAGGGAPARLRTTPDDKPPLPPDRSAPLLAFAVPDNVRGHLDLSVDDLLWRGGILRGVALKGALDQGVLTIAQGSALLPGSTSLSLGGTVSSPNGSPQADLHVQLVAADVRGLIGWLGYSVGGVPADRLRGLSVKGAVTLAGDQLDVQASDVILDATRFQATASARLRGKPGIGLHIAADHVNADAYIAAGDVVPPVPGLPAPPPAPSSPSPSPSPSPGTAPDRPMLITLLDNLDANLDMTLGEATWRGQSLRKLRLAGTLQDGGLTIDELSIGDLGGASGKVTGLVEGLAGGGLKGQLFFDASGPAVERVLRLAWPDATFGQTFGAFHLEGGAQVDQGGTDIDCDLDVLGGRAHIVGILPQGGAGSDLTLSVDHPDFTGLAHALWPTYRPAGGALGALKLSTHLKGGGGQFEIGAFSLAIGASTLSGTGSLGLDGARPKLTATLDGGDWAIDALLPVRQTAAAEEGAGGGALAPGVILAQAGTAMPHVPPSARWSRTPADWSELQLVDLAVTYAGKSVSYGAWRLDQPTATVALADGTLDIGKLSGRVYGGQLDGALHLATKTAEALHVQMTVRDADLKAALAGLAGVKAIDGRADLSADLVTGGASLLDLISHLAGTVSVKARDGSLQGIDVRAVADRLDASKPVDLLGLAKAVGGGATRYATLDGGFRVKDGVATSDDLHLVVDGGEGHSALAIDLPTWTLDGKVEFRLASVAGVPPLMLHINGSLDDPHETFDVNPLSQFLMQRATKAGDAPGDADKNPKLRDLLKGLGLHQ
jgi:uncharacterized protein involved in outer membrane biogenesis